MKKQTISLSLACAVALVFTGCATEHHSTAYEYKVIRMLAYPGETTKQLNDFAQQGWSVVTVSLSEEGLPSEKMMQTATIVLKRVKK